MTDDVQGIAAAQLTADDQRHALRLAALGYQPQDIAKALDVPEPDLAAVKAIAAQSQEQAP